MALELQTGLLRVQDLGTGRTSPDGFNIGIGTGQNGSTATAPLSTSTLQQPPLLVAGAYPGQQDFISSFRGFTNWEPPTSARSPDYVNQADFIEKEGLEVVGQVGNTVIVTQEGRADDARAAVNQSLAFLNSTPVGRTLVNQLYNASTPKMLYVNYYTNEWGGGHNYTQSMQNLASQTDPSDPSRSYYAPDGNFRSNTHIVSWNPELAPKISNPDQSSFFEPPVIVLAHELAHLRGIQEDFQAHAYRVRTDYSELEENDYVLRYFENPLLETMGYPQRTEYGGIGEWLRVETPLEGRRP